MSFYRNRKGHTAKLLSGLTAVVMFEYRTMFFDSARAADLYLKSIGFYKAA